MPTEHRRIVFANDELYEILRRYTAGIGQKLPTGVIVSVKIIADGGQLALNIFDREREDVHEARIDGPHVAAALLKYCFSRRIPIPRDAQKSLTVYGDNLALEIRKETKLSAVIIVQD